MRIGRILVLALVVSATAFTQTAQEILRKTAANYQNLRSGHFEALSVADTVETRLVVSFVKPDKFRVEYFYPKGGHWLRVTDGRTAWQYRGWTKEFTEQPAGARDLEMLAGTPLRRFARIDERAAGARLLREEPVRFEGRPVPCYVVGTPDGGTFWIDKARYLVLQAGRDQRLTRFTAIRLNQPLDAGQFVFTPPPGAKKQASD